MTKVCNMCKAEKSLDSFTKNKHCTGGVTNSCRGCINERQARFRQCNREHVNAQARKYNRKDNPELIIKDQLKEQGIKRCSGCLQTHAVSEFLYQSAICYQCRTGHERGFFKSKADNGRFVKILSDDEKKRRHNLNARKWRINNPDRVKAIQKKSRSRPEAILRNRELRRKSYALGLDQLSRVRYQNSEKGKNASCKAKRKWVANNPDKMLEKERRARQNLTDRYVRRKAVQRRGFTREQLDQNPEILNILRIIIKTKRLCKSQTSSS